MKKFKKLHLCISFVLMTLYLNAQETESKFEIRIFNNKGTIGVLCNKGCSWTDLYIRSNMFYINQFGMVKIKNKDEIKNSSFVFSVKKTGNGLTLKAIKGINWEKQSFKLSKDNSNAIIVNNIKIFVE